MSHGGDRDPGTDYSNDRCRFERWVGSGSTRDHPGSGSARGTSTSRRVAELADDIASLFELALFEFDLVLHKGLYVVDVNPVVSLAGVSDGGLLCEELLRRSLRDP